MPASLTITAAIIGMVVAGSPAMRATRVVISGREGMVWMPSTISVNEVRSAVIRPC